MATTENGGGNSVTPPNDGTAQTEFKVPEGKVILDSADYERFRQNTERVRGMQSYYEAGNKYGLKRPEDFARLEQINKFEGLLKNKGMTMDQMLAAFESPQQTEGSAGFDMATLEKEFSGKFVAADKLDSEFETRFGKYTALNEHKAAYSKEPELLAQALKDALPENADPRDRRALAAEVRALMSDYNRREMYPENHPLHKEHLAPWTDKHIAKLIADVKKELALADGEAMAKAGDAVLKGKVSTPAGSTSTTPTKNPKPNDDQRPGGLPSKASVEAAYAKKQARRGGGPVSSMGG